MTYREAESLRRLLADVNALAPRRSKASDGWIGDAAHASRSSDHNPWVKDQRGVGVVRARDFTHDPAGGFDAGQLATHVASLLGNHPALTSGAYVIWQGRIISTSRKAEGWRSYSGSNPHNHHVHISVGTSGYDSTASWSWPPLAPKPSKPAGPTKAQRKKARRLTTRALRFFEDKGLQGGWFLKQARKRTHRKNEKG